MIKAAIHPPGHPETATRIARALNIPAIPYYADGKDMFSYRDSLLFCAPPPERMTDTPADYHKVREFYVAGKGLQRRILATLGVPVPLTILSPEEARTLTGLADNTRWVLRPERHTRGAGFRVVSDLSGMREGFYCSPLFDKTAEFRVLFAYGKHLATMTKIPPNPPTHAWIEAEGTRYTRAEPGCVLEYTDFYSVMENCRIVQLMPVCGADVMLNISNNWQLLELNQCPHLALPNRTALVELIRAQNSAAAGTP